MSNHGKVTEAGARKVCNAYETNVLNLVQTWIREENLSGLIGEEQARAQLLS